MKLRYLFLSMIILAVNSIALGQKEYAIRIEMPGSQDSVYYLAVYQAEKILMADTSLGRQSIAEFSGKKELKQGIYVLANEKKEKILEFLIGPEQNFTIKLDDTFNPANAKIIGSLDNELFFQHVSLINRIYPELQQLRTEASQMPETSVQRVRIEELISKRNEELSQFRNQALEKHPNLLFTKILLAMQDPEVPENIRNDQEKSYRFFKNNFWESFDLSDDRLLRTPLLPRKLETYFEQLILPQADSVIKEVEMVLQLTNGNQEMIDYLAWHFVSEYQNPKIMGLDKVFVHLADQWFKAGKVSNVTSSILEKINERADKMRHALIGNQAPDLWLIDTEGSYRSFKELKTDFVVIIFWDQTCGHCKKEMETLAELYERRKASLSVFAVNTTNDFDGWKHYINEKQYPWLHVNGTRSMTENYNNLYDIYSVPVIYVLDKSKKIIGKRIAAQQIEGLMDQQ